MTTERPEIVVEGSADGSTWLEYAFKWKPGDPARAPRFALTHMPRLDWRMWFAALDPRGNSHWLLPLAEGLLEDDPAALGLLGGTPFPDGPPRYVRLTMYRYRFTTREEAADGAWWVRERLGPMTEPLTRALNGPRSARQSRPAEPTYSRGRGRVDGGTTRTIETTALAPAPDPVRDIIAR